MNTNRTRPVRTSVRVQGRQMAQGRIYWHALQPEFEIIEYRSEHAAPRESALGDQAGWTFPAASVSAVGLQVESA